ncbi:MAG: hypothetical protein RBQ96_06175 [Candidatus Methanomethylophilaceae archaeon]|nr:hypothetical protein [Candidatus Methanomethylophilaceae archaeon]
MLREKSFRIRERSYDNSYKNERSRKKLLVPVVALVVCAAAMIGLGYAALVSDVTNTANVVVGDGLTADLYSDFETEDGVRLTGQDFAKDEDAINYSTSTVNGSTTYKVDADDEIKLGGAVLRVEALTTAGTANVTHVNVWYEIAWDGSAPFGMTSSLEIGGQTITPGEDNGTATLLALSGATEFAVVLNGAIPDDVTGLASMPEIPTYSITFHVVPA